MSTNRLHQEMVKLNADLRKIKDWDEIDWLIGLANPNPDRIGCPSREMLIALSRRERPIGDPAHEHVAHCSECFLELRLIQDADGRPAHWR